MPRCTRLRKADSSVPLCRVCSSKSNGKCCNMWPTLTCSCVVCTARKADKGGGSQRQARKATHNQNYSDTSTCWTKLDPFFEGKGKLNATRHRDCRSKQSRASPLSDDSTPKRSTKRTKTTDATMTTNKNVAVGNMDLSKRSNTLR